MIFYKQLLILLGSSVLAMFLVVGGVVLFHDDPAVPTQGAMASFSPDQLRVAKRETQSVSGLKNPVGGDQAPTRKDYPPVPLQDAVAGASAGASSAEKSTPPGAIVRMVIIQEARKFALVDGQIVKEGDLVNTRKVVKIERDKVLLKNGSTPATWVPLAQDQPPAKAAPARQGGSDTSVQVNNTPAGTTDEKLTSTMSEVRRTIDEVRANDKRATR